MKKVVIFIAIILMLTSCRHADRIHTHSAEMRTEKEIIQDTVFVTQQDSASFAALLECDSVGKVRLTHIRELQGKLNARLTVDIHDNTLTADCHCDSMAIYATLKHRFTTVEKVEKETKKHNSSGRSFPWLYALFILPAAALVFVLSLSIYNQR